MTRFTCAALVFAVTFTVAALAGNRCAGEPVVTETRDGGKSVLRIVSAEGKEKDVYRIDLSRHGSPAQKPSDLLRRWEAWRFGAFLCFNSNQFTGEEFCKLRDPKLYDPRQLDVAGWVAAFKEAGMTYAVLTTRHTSGFLLWDSATSEFDVASSGNTTDVCRRFVDECRRQGLQPAFYYCLWGGKAWNPNPHARAIILAQLYELATRYGEIPYFWLDMKCWGPADLSTQEIYDELKSLQPNCVVEFNQHIQDGSQIRYFPTDVVDGEMTPPPAPGHNPMRTVEGKTYYLPFDYNFVSQERAGRGVWFTYGEGKKFAPSRPCPPEVIAAKIRTGYHRGAAHVLLAAAPDHTGRLRAEDVEQLKSIGRLLREPEPPQAVSQTCRVTASSTWKNDPKYGPEMAVDGDPDTRWGGGVDTKDGWLEIDLGGPKRFDTLKVEEGWDRTQRFELQIQENGQWRAILHGQQLGTHFARQFPPVTAQHVRLNILEATDVPTIWEFQLHDMKGRTLPPDTLRAKPEAIEAWKDMRFGMFICWGPVTLTGREIGWSRGAPTPIAEYDNLYKTWNPDKFDARQWVKVAKQTGCKYIVFLLKHHDGFCLWDTKQTDYNIMNGPLRRDVAKEIAAACRAEGIGFFPYYSTCDWHHPDFPATSPGGKVKRPVANLDRYTEYLEAQVKELITGYGPLVGIWFDVPQHFDKARGQRVIRHVRALQPDILVNNRTGAPGDFDTPEQTVGRCQFHRPWESCITLGTQWAWKPDDALKPHTDAIRMLVACAVGDGNLALNTNPMPDGRIEPRQVESFRKIGQWLERYGESIYGTRGGPFVSAGSGAVRAHGGRFAMPGGDWWGGSTHKGNVIYLHVLRWPTDTIRLPAIDKKIIAHSVLTGGKAAIHETAAGISVSVPAGQRDPVDTIIKLELGRD